MAKKTKKRVRREYTKTEEKELRAHSKARTPVRRIAKLTKPQKVLYARRLKHWVSASAISANTRLSEASSLRASLDLDSNTRKL